MNVTIERYVWSVGRRLPSGQGAILARGPYGVDAEALVVVDVQPQPSIAAGADVAEALSARGYTGP